MMYIGGFNGLWLQMAHGVQNPMLSLGRQVQILCEDCTAVLGETSDLLLHGGPRIHLSAATCCWLVQSLPVLAVLVPAAVSFLRIAHALPLLCGALHVWACSTALVCLWPIAAAALRHLCRKAAGEGIAVLPTLISPCRRRLCAAWPPCPKRCCPCACKSSSSSSCAPTC